MYKNSKPRSAMIVDSDASFLEVMMNDPGASSAPPVIARTGKEAQLTLANPQIPIAGLFVSANLSSERGRPGANSVIRFAHQQRPSTPIYVLQNEGPPLMSLDELKSFGVRSSLNKPLTYSDMLELVAAHAVMFDQKTMMSKPNTDKIGEAATAEDADFIAIRAAGFVSGAICLFNVYYRFASGRYVKILSGGDSFAPDRLAVYLQKGAEFFHLRKEDQKAYLAYCKQLATSVIRQDSIAIEIKSKQALNYGQETLNFLKTQGLSEANLTHATTFVDNLQHVVVEIGLKENEALKDFFENFENYEHGVSTAMVTSLMASVSGIESGSIMQIVGVASLLHDIGLYQLPPELQDEDEEKMTPEQFEVFRTHPEIGADMLKKTPGTHPSVVQAVMQHHERRGKKPFKPSGKATSMNRVAELIGIADEYLGLMKRAKTDPKLDIRYQLERSVFPCFSMAVVEYFRSIFCRIT